MGEFEDQNLKFYHITESTPGQQKGCLLAIVSILIFTTLTMLN